MKLPELKKVRTDNADVIDLQGNVKEYVDLINAPFVRGRFLTIFENQRETSLITITASPQEFEHKLGQTIEGFILLDRRADHTVWRVVGTEDQKLFINLQAGGTVQCRVWVF